jgi:hypothetical protein
MRVRLIILVIMIFSCLSCSNNSNPIVSNSQISPNEPKSEGVVSDAEDVSRNLNAFGNFTTIFPEVGITGIFYDADISEIINGPDSEETGAPGYLWLDSQDRPWTVAVALEETATTLDTDRMIWYRFLGPNIASHMFRIDGIEGNIRLARVASCYFEGDDPDDEDDTFVEVTIVYQIWNNDDQEWDIHAYRMGIDPDLFVNLNSQNDYVYWDTDYEFSYTMPEGSPPGYGEMMPDVAYDPRNGNLYAVMTRYEDVDASLPRIWMRSSLRGHAPIFSHQNLVWFFNSQRCQFGDTGTPYFKPYHGFHPRIDIGHVTFFPFPQSSPPPDWYLAIVYTCDDNIFNPYFSYWPAGPCPGEGNFNQIKIGVGAKAGFMPVIDIGLPDADNCAITWTQTRSESWNDVTVGYMDSHYGNFYVEPDTGLVSSAFPSVSVLSGSEDIFPTSLFFLESNNPNTLDWRPSYRHVETDWTNWPVEWNLGVETNLNLEFLGDYDSGSQFSNWYGMSSAISGDNYCWTLWSSHQEHDDDWNHLNQVYGAYGYTE